MGWPSAQHCGSDDTENKKMTIKIIIFINDSKFRIGHKVPNFCDRNRTCVVCTYEHLGKIHKKG
jgi:hypothetical protein